MARAEERYGPIFEQYAALPIEQVAADPNALRIGERLFASYCAVCHGSDAGGGARLPEPARRLLALGRGAGADQDQHPRRPYRDHAGMAGRARRRVPAWRRRSRTCAPSPGAPWTRRRPRPGRRSTTPFCVACHAADGTGNPALGAPSLVDGVWLYGGSDADVRHSIAEGREGRMPAHGEFLGEARVHVLAAWVWSLSNR